MQRRKSKALDQELTERGQLLRAWRAWHREELEHALDGSHGSVVGGLMKQLHRLQDSRDLLAFVAARNWSVIDYETRLVCLHEINSAIARHRERFGLAPFDDTGENTFRAIKRMLFPAT